MYELWLYDLLTLSWLDSGPGFDLWCETKVEPSEKWLRWTQNESYDKPSRESSYDLRADGGQGR